MLSLIKKHIQVFSRMMLIICLLAMSSVSPVFAETQAISATAENFIQAFEKQAVKRCQLLTSRCGKEKFHIIDQGAGESNDQKQVWREMQLKGLQVVAIDPETKPASYYFAKITVLSRQV